MPRCGTLVGRLIAGLRFFSVYFGFAIAHYPLPASVLSTALVSCTPTVICGFFWQQQAVEFVVKSVGGKLVASEVLPVGADRTTTTAAAARSPFAQSVAAPEDRAVGMFDGRFGGDAPRATAHSNTDSGGLFRGGFGSLPPAAAQVPVAEVAPENAGDEYANVLWKRVDPAGGKLLQAEWQTAESWVAKRTLHNQQMHVLRKQYVLRVTCANRCPALLIGFG
jgi:hypothetical protein